MGGTPAAIFDIFGITLIEEFQMHFQNSWMLVAQYLRIHTMISKDKTQVEGEDLDFFDMDLFVQERWAEYWITHRRSKREEFNTEFGLRKAHDKHKKKQFDNDLSEATNGSHVVKRCSRKAKTTSKASKATRSPMKEKRYVDHDEDSPPPSSDESKVSSRLSFDLEKSMMIVAPRYTSGGSILSSFNLKSF